MGEGRRETKGMRGVAAVGVLLALTTFPSLKSASCFSSFQPMTTRSLQPPTMPMSHHHRQDWLWKRSSSRVLYYQNNDDDLGAAGAPAPLELSVSDLARLQKMQQQQDKVVIPVIVLDAMVPKQELTLQAPPSSQLRNLYDYALETNHCAASSTSNTGKLIGKDDADVAEIGVIGFSPSGRLLSRGVIVEVSSPDNNVDDISPSSSSTTTELKMVATHRRFETKGEPWYEDEAILAHVDMIHNLNDRAEETISSQQIDTAIKLSRTLTKVMEEWSQLIVETGITTQQGLQSRMDHDTAALGPMPTIGCKNLEYSLTDQAFWVAAMLNPLPAYEGGFCYAGEIRPAMLTCTNAFDRMRLAVQSVQTSINHMKQRKGKLS